MIDKEQVLKIAKECGIDGLNPMGFYMTDSRLAWIEAFAAAMYAKGAEDARGQIPVAEVTQGVRGNRLMWHTTDSQTETPVGSLLYIALPINTEGEQG